MTGRLAPPLRVDTHAHVYLTSMPLAEGAWHRPPRSASIDDYVAVLARHGVSHAALAAASLYGDYSDYTLEALRRHPHLRATVIVKPGVDPGVLREMAAQGVVGIRLQWRGLHRTPDLGDPAHQRLLRHVTELGWHVHIHDDAPRLAAALPVLEASGVNLVVDHFGRADPAQGLACAGFQALLASVRRGRTWVKLSAAFRLESMAAAAAYSDALLDAGGPDRLFWGSDWPFAAFEDAVTYADTLAAFEACVPQAEVRERIAASALRFYFGGQAGVR
jgi:predicted TIM-barrel fold metal-dependent hydrolase